MDFMGNLKITYKKILEVLEKNNLLVEHNIEDYDLNQEIEFISHDSRNIKKNTLFFSKTLHNKEEYLADAVKKGAVCYVSEEKYDLRVGNDPCVVPPLKTNITNGKLNSWNDTGVVPYNIIVNNIFRSIAIIAPLYYDYPYEDLEIIGITGTKGKTTVAYFIRNILDEYVNSVNSPLSLRRHPPSQVCEGGKEEPKAPFVYEGGKRRSRRGERDGGGGEAVGGSSSQKLQTGLISTIETYTGRRSEESLNSTPEPCDLQQYFHETKESGIKWLTMEVTSQAYKRDRVYGIKFNNGIFLNIAEDHISPAEHEDFNDYLNCKLEFMKNCSNIVINRETDCFDMVLEAAQSSKTLSQITLYGSEKVKNECDYYYSDIKREKDKLNFYVTNNNLKYCEKFAIKTPGLFNVENATAAITMCKTLGIGDDSIRKGLIETEVPGRMTIFESESENENEENNITVIVDYAHNLLSFTKLYESVKLDYSGRRIISVGGAPGEKAYRRRKDFADVVGKYSGYIYLTAEDPQYEDVTKICEEIAGYMPNTPYEIIPDRSEAVTKSILEAKPGDVVVLLAKSEETYQKVRGKKEFYESDLAIAKRVLESKTLNKQTKKSREAAMI